MKVAPSEVSSEAPESKDKEMKALDVVIENYFRAKLYFQDPSFSIPKTRKPVIFANNHSGMSFPWDAVILFRLLRRHFGTYLPLTAMATPALFRIPLMEYYGIPGVLDRFAVEASMKNYGLLIKKESNILVYPEGIAGIGKGFNNRYRLQRFSTSMVRVCLQHRIDLVPIYTVNGEYLNPYAYKFRQLNSLVQKIGIPFLPVGIGVLLALVLPMAFYMVWPANLKYVIGSPIDVGALVDKPWDQISESEIQLVTVEIHDLMQANLDRFVKIHGSKRYDIKEFLKSLFRLRARALMILPLFWPIYFHRAHLKPNSKLSEKCSAAAICIFLSLPVLGWPLYVFFISRRRRLKK